MAPAALRLWVGGLVLMAAVLRLGAARGELWLDEIWSLQLAARLPTPLHAFGLAHDNNHIANTLWLSVLPADLPALAYRLPAVVAGVAMVLLAWLWSRRHGVATGLATAALLACSLMLVHYGSEARGYGLALGSIMLALFVLEQRLAAGARAGSVLLFGAAVGLALFAHLSSVTAYLALGGYWLAARRPRLSSSELLREGVLLHGVPVAVGLALAAGFVRGMRIGGGFETGQLETLRDTAGFCFGLQLPPSLAWVAAAALLALLAVGARMLWRGARAELVLYGLGVFVPVLAMALRDPRHLAPRYLLISVLFLALLSGRVLGTALAGGGVRRVAAGAALALLLVGNLAGDFQLLRDGRGGYRAAVAHVVAQSGPGPITLTSDNDFRNPMVLAFHGRGLPGAERIRFFPAAQRPAQGTDWLILHRIGGRGGEPQPAVRFRGHRFERASAFPSAPLSGMAWYLYRRAGPSP